MPIICKINKYKYYKLIYRDGKTMPTKWKFTLIKLRLIRHYSRMIHKEAHNLINDIISNIFLFLYFFFISSSDYIC